MALLNLTGGAQIAWLLEPGPAGRLGAARTRGAVVGVTGEALAWVVVEDGRGRLHAGDHAIGVDGREGVLERAACPALTRPASTFAREGHRPASVVSRADDRPTPP